MPYLFGDISDEVNFNRFMDYLSGTNYFKSSGINQDILFQERPENYYDFLRFMMDIYSEELGKKYWLQKTDTFNLEILYKNFADAKFILIYRNIIDNIRSSFGLKKHDIGMDYRGNIPREMTKYYVAYKRIKEYSRKERVMVVRFEDLKIRRKELVDEICSFLGIDFDENMLKDKFVKNTSFRSGVIREEVLNKRGEILIRILQPLFILIPFPVYELIYRIKFTVLPVKNLNTSNNEVTESKI